MNLNESRVIVLWDHIYPYLLNLLSGGDYMPYDRRDSFYFKNENKNSYIKIIKNECYYPTVQSFIFDANFRIGGESMFYDQF